MTWLVWRQHRIQYLIGAALLAAFAVMIVVTGTQVSDQFQSAQAASAGSVRRSRAPAVTPSATANTE